MNVFSGLTVASFVLAVLDKMPWWPFWVLVSVCAVGLGLSVLIAMVK
jgi:hypothetical protein